MAVFGPGPFRVRSVVDRSALGLLSDLLLDTELGECPICSLWVTLAGPPAEDCSQAGK
jgi:hypothetical protein